MISVLEHPHANTAACEAYPPNAALCRERLLPLGIDFREGGADNLPFEDASLDMIINRHGDWNTAEIHRTLKKPKRPSSMVRSFSESPMQSTSSGR